MYYPLSQVTPNLYSNKEYILISSRNSYTGYYWKSSDGRFFTGKTPQDTPVEELIPINQFNVNVIPSISAQYIEYVNTGSDNLTYNQLKNTNTTPIPIPIYYITLPTQQDYQTGEFIRYFCKKINEVIYLEISKDTYNKLINKSSEIYWRLYQPFNIPWQLTGDKEQVYITNRNIVELTMKQQKLPQFDLYLKKDYIKYYQ